MLALLSLAALSLQPPAAPAAEPPLDWRANETLLTDHVQLTFPDRFIRAGEAYFDHQTPPRLVIFQAIERPTAATKEGGKAPEPSPHYGMYIARLVYDANKPVALGQITRVSPPDSANTCGWFHPTEAAAFLYATTTVAPKSETTPGFQRGTGRYRWDFPSEMSIVGQVIKSIDAESIKELLQDDPKWTPIDPDWKSRSGAPSVDVMLKDTPKLVETLPGPQGYAAECSFDSSARNIVYTYVNPETKDPDIYLYDTKTKQNVTLISAKGYDGGPFFSPDGKWICYRSDRRGDNNLQLFIAKLAFADKADPARITGVEREIQLTNDAEVVNWAPFWHPSGSWLVYASSAVAHSNYEVFAIDVSAAMKSESGKLDAPLPRVRLTHASGFDGLPAFSTDGQYLLITSQRGPKFGTDTRPTSQLWIAKVATTPDWSKPAPLPPQFKAE